jgi:hypothetical protein
LRSGDPDTDDPAKAGCWGKERRVRAEVVTALLLGACDLERGHFPAVRLRGARITGRVDLMGAVITHALVLEHCWFDEPLRFVEASTKTIRITSSHLLAFNGARMRTEGILNFHLSVIEGIVRLDRAQVAGEISFRGARVGDGTGEAIAGDGLCVDGDMECNAGFTARGQVNLRGARIAGRLSFRGAILGATGTAVQLARLQADEVCLRTAQPITGAIRLAQARVAILDDDPAVWPPEIWLNGFTYETIRHLTGRVPVAERIDWVSRGPFGYQPQPYEQLAAYYQHAGHDDDVRHVLAPADHAQRPRPRRRPAARRDRRLRVPALARSDLAGPAAHSRHLRLRHRPAASPGRRASAALQPLHLHPGPAHPHRRVRAPQRIRFHRRCAMAGRRPDRSRLDTCHRRHRRRHPRGTPRLARPQPAWKARPPKTPAKPATGPTESSRPCSHEP